MTGKWIVWGAAACGLVAATPVAAQQAAYPSRTVSVVLPMGVGGVVDNITRAMMPHLSQRLGKSVVIDNRPGGGMSIGASYVANAEPDGHTLMNAPSGVYAINPTFFKRISYNPLTDFTPIAIYAENAFVLVVNPDLPIRSVDELIRYSKSNPGKLTFGASTLGSVIHLGGELLKKDIDMVIVPYKQGAPAALQDVVAGHASMTFADPSLAPAFVTSGKVRALAVSSAARLPSLPDVPTLSEAGLKGLVATSWHMMVAPARVPMPIAQKLHTEMKQIGNLPEIVQHKNRLGLAHVDSPSIDEMRTFLKNEIERWGKIIREAGIAGGG